MADNFQFVLGSAICGVPWTPTGQLLLLKGMQGGQGTAVFFSAQYAVGMLVSALNSGSVVWSQASDANGYPTWTASLPIFESALTITITTTVDSDVISGSTEPPSFTWEGNSYNVVGTFSGNVTYGDTSVWTIQVPVGLYSAIAVTALGSYAWSGLVSPLLNGFWQGVKSCFAQADSVVTAEEAAAASEEAAEEAAVEDTAVEGAEVSLETGGAAFIAIVVIAAVQYLLAKLDHITYHNLRVYNLTAYQITWQPPTIYNDEATMISMPVLGDGSGSYDLVIPPLSSEVPPGGQSVEVASEASFAFASTSGFAGFAYVLPLALADASSGAVLGQAAALFDLPWGAHNSLYGSFEDLDPQSLFDNWDGALKLTQYSTSSTLPDGNTVTMTMTYDYISGEQTAPDGQSAYLYNSLLVFEIASSQLADRVARSVQTAHGTLQTLTSLSKAMGRRPS